MSLVQVYIPPKLRPEGTARETPSQGGEATAKARMEHRELDLSGPLHVPSFRLEALESGRLLLDTDEANWLFVNEQGYGILNDIRAANGATRYELWGGNGHDLAALAKFLKQCAKRGFVANQSFERAPYLGRQALLGLDRLHEFWIIPNYDCNLRCRHCYTIEQVMHACASNGPKKDFCGAGYTILGVDPDGSLKTCAATINDHRFSLGKLLDADGNYVTGRLAGLWKDGERAKWVRSFTLARQRGERQDDLRFFHGGACWYNMPDPEAALSTEHPFYETLETQTLKAIIGEARKRARFPRKDIPAVLSYMHRSRIACAGARKTTDHSEEGLDNGYCICFA